MVLEWFLNTGLIKLLLHFGCRSSELITARVDDFDFINKVWTVPPERHKTGYNR